MIEPPTQGQEQRSGDEGDARDKRYFFIRGAAKLPNSQ